MWQKKILKFFFSRVDPNDLLLLAYDLPICTRSKMAILLACPSFFFHFSRDFTIDCLKQSKRDPPKWPIFQAQHLFLYLCYQKDTYRAFSIWTYLCLETKILKLANFIFDISSFKRNFFDFQKKWPKMGGLCGQMKLPNYKIFWFFFNFKNISLAPLNDFLIS